MVGWVFLGVCGFAVLTVATLILEKENRFYRKYRRIPEFARRQQHSALFLAESCESVKEWSPIWNELRVGTLKTLLARGVETEEKVAEDKWWKQFLDAIPKEMSPEDRRKAVEALLFYCDAQQKVMSGERNSVNEICRSVNEISEIEEDSVRKVVTEGLFYAHKALLSEKDPDTTKLDIISKFYWGVSFYLRDWSNLLCRTIPPRPEGDEPWPTEL